MQSPGTVNTPVCWNLVAYKTTCLLGWQPKIGAVNDAHTLIRRLVSRRTLLSPGTVGSCDLRNAVPLLLSHWHPVSAFSPLLQEYD